jgi:hypothetical protein
VGYVDDSETPEMIMKKFEMLEKIKRESEAAQAAAKQQQSETGGTATDEPNANGSTEVHPCSPTKQS